MRLTSLRKCISVLLIATQLVQPVIAAERQEYRIPLRTLKPTPAPQPGAGDGVVDTGDDPTPAELTIKPDIQQFDITGGVRRTRTSLLINSGTSPATLSPIESNDDFSVTNNCPATLYVGQSCNLSVTPTSLATKGAAYQLAVLAKTAYAPVFLDLSTTAQDTRDPAPHLVFEKELINLGTDLAPLATASDTTILVNQGNAPATLGGISSSSDFTVNSDCPATLQPQSQCTISAFFSSYVPGTHAHTLSVTSGVAGSVTPATFYASVKSDPIKRPVLTFDINPLSFGTLDVGAVVTKTATLRNVGELPALLAPLKSSPESSPNFQVQSDCPSTLAVGGHCTVSATFTAHEAGTNPSYNLEAKAQGGVKTQVLMQATVKGTKDNTPHPELTFTPDGLSYADVPVGQLVVRGTTVTNIGPLAASVKSIAVDTNPAEFSQTNDCGSSIAPGASCAITVSFKATSYGPRVGRVYVELTNGPHSILMLSGRGLAASLVTDSSSVQFGAIVLPAVSPVRTLSVANSGNIPLTGLSVVNSDPRLAIGYGDCTDTLQPNTGCTLTLQYTPGTDGAIKSSFQLSSSNAGSKTIAVDGVATKLAINPASLEFPTTIAGTPAADQSVTVTNTGTAPATLDGVSVSGGGLYFNQSNNCGAPLAPGASCAIVVRYTPSNVSPNTETPQQGALSIALRSTEVGHVSLKGTGLNPRLVLSPSSVRTPSTLVGRTSAPANFSVTNPTGELVRITGMSVVSGAAEFAQNNDCGTELAPGASCTVTVQFKPANKGERSGVWVATTSLGDYTAGLGGEGAVTLNLTTASLQFSPTNVGKSSEVLTVIVSNPTALAADLSGPGQGVSLVAGAGDFGHTNNCGTSLAAGASCSASIMFTPTVKGDRTGQWAASSSFGTYGVTLAGTATEPVGEIAPDVIPSGNGSGDGFTHYTIKFLDTEVGVSSAVRDVKFTNRGTGPLTVQGVTLLNGDTDFSESNNCGKVLQPGAFCTISLMFTPSALGSRTGNVVLLSETGNYSFDMLGNGIGASGQWTADIGADFGDVAIGSTSQRSFTFRNTGTLTAKNLSVSSTGADVTIVSNACGTSQAPISLAAGGSCKVSVKYSPITVGKMTGGALVAVGRLANAPSSIALAGNAPAPSLAFDATPSGAYGAVTVGTSNTRTFVLKNTGKFTDILSPAPLLSGTGFAITGGTCTDGLSLDVNGICTLVVTENAITTGTLSATITVTSKQGASTNLALSASAIQSAYAVTGSAGANTVPDTNFGQVTAGTPTPVVKYVYLRDNSSAAVVVANLATLEGDSSFSVTGVAVVDSAGGLVANCTATATGLTAKCAANAPGQALRVGVKFAPVSAGVKATTLHFEHNGSQGQSDVQLTGTGVFDANGVWSTDWSAASAPTTATTNYGGVTVGTGTVDKTFFVQNTGKYGEAAVGFALSGDTGPYQIVNVIRVGWGGNGGYSSASCISGGVISADKLSATPCLAQEPGWPSTSQVAVTVRFAPKAAGTYKLVVTPTTNNGTVLPAPLTITGNGLFNATGVWSTDYYYITPPSGSFLAYGAQSMGSSTDKTIFVKNTGTNGAEAVGFTLSGDTSQFQIVSTFRAGLGGNGGYATAGCITGGVIAADKLSTTPCLAQEPGWPTTPDVAIIVRFVPKAAGSYSLTVTPTTNNGTTLPAPITMTGTGR